VEVTQLIAFPPQPLPLPEATIGYRFNITSGGSIARVHDRDEPLPPPRKYHEAYLQLLALDLEDRRAIIKFLNANGPLGQRHEPHRGFDWHGSFATMNEILDQAETDSLFEVTDWELRPASMQRYAFVQTLTQFRWQAMCLRDLIRAWRWFREGIAVAPAEWESPVWADEDEDFPLPRSSHQAAELLWQGIRSGLTPFHPELRISAFEGDPRMTTNYGGGITFYSICCLELFNLIVRDTELSQCANERCQRMFGLQEGRSQKGRHRSVGVKYCSLSCARAQTQREYRRRQARSGES
jgi:hypothetical protein